MNNLTGVELVQMTSPEGDHAANGFAEVDVREIKAQTSVNSTPHTSHFLVDLHARAWLKS